jgi:carboxypeptidase C (cathepsin A)/outer membrane protein OmpA-like peptidoglycan-associated protein/subtilisin family serine protease
MGPDLWEMFEDGAGDDEVAAILRLGHAGTLPKGVRLITQFGEIVTIRTTRSNILSVSASPEVADIAAGDTYLGPDVEATETTNSAELSSDTVLDTDERRPPDEKVTGRGVVIGLVDWGFDFAHPDFLKLDGTSRILAIWDQRGSKLANSPQPFGYGVVHDQDAINRALKQPDPYAALGYHPADADTGIGSHGTHVLSIAAGGGGEERPVGVAPEADLVVVHNAPWDEIDTGRLGDSVTLLEGIDFIARLAGDRPWVINLSMGKHGEQHDGSTLIEQGLDAAIRSSAGRAVCLSAGNYFDKRIHASGQLRPTQERTITWEIQENKPTNNQLEFWYSWQDKFEVRVKSPDGAIAARAAIGERAKFLVGGKEVGNVYHRGQEPNNLDNHIVIYLYKEAPTGEWEITLVGEDVIDGRYHAWIERDVSCSRCQSRLREGDADPHCTTGTICNGRRTLAVGAYNKHDPEMRLAHFSSVGPTRDGRLKPDLCAPGVAILAARSAPREKRDPPQLCTRMSGTSMAAPCVTGTIALMFQAAPRRLRIEETHNIILQSARKVSVPEEIPERIGIGFLDIEEAVDAARKLSPLASSFKQTTVHSAPAEKPKEQTREKETATSQAAASEGFSPGAGLAVALALAGGGMSGSPDSEAEVAGEVAPFSFDENYRTPSGQPARSAGEEWAELADDIVADIGEGHSVKVLHEMFERSDDLSDLVTDVSGNAPTAAQIFDALVYSANPQLRQQLTQNFQIVALPKESAEGKVHVGDVLVRRTDGSGGHVSIIAAPGLKDLASLNAEGLVAESDTPGQYVQVIEGGGEFAHESEDKYARQLADGFGRVLNDVVLLRLATPTQSVVTVNQTAPAAPTAKDPDGDESEAESEVFDDNDLRYDMTELPPVQTPHQVMVNGSTLKYTATAGRLPIKSGDGQTRAEMFYVAYTLDGQEAAKRPLTFLFNGGPGSASLWLHMGAMGPRKVALQPEGFLPPAPYHFESNPNTLLDKSDLVFVDAIGTGFSRAADSRSFGYFWGVRGDIEAFSEFIRLFITRNERWGSPLFLFGESYGTLRAAGIAGYLSGKGISFSGITLLSTVLNYQTLEATKTNDQPYIFLVPTFTMIAGYHHKLPADLASDMKRARREAEQWASSEYARALAKGDALTAAERQQAIDQMARYTGLSKDVIDEANLRIDVRKFTHYLLLDKKLRVGRFDGRFTGTDPQGLLDTQYYDPTEAATHPPFTSVFNNYVRSELGYKTDMPYYARAQDADADSWNWGSAIDGFPDTATALREAIVKNPYLRILVMEGLYDLATPYSAADYTVDHLDLPARYRDNISVATYEAGHMVYLPEAGLKKMKVDEADFVARSVAPQKQTARESSENTGTSEDDDSSLLLTLNGVSLQDIGNGFLGRVPADTQAAILSLGETDAKALANVAFWQKYPKLAGKKLDEKDSSQASLRREWSNLYFRGIRPLIWLRAMINELDKYRGNIPREFLLGWIAWESSGDLKSFTTLGELGYFQIMWRSGEAKEQLHMTPEEFPKLSTDPDFSVAKGVALAQAYRDYVSKNYPDIAENSDLQLRLTKGRHAASGVLRGALRRLEKASTPITWASISKVLPDWMVDNIGNTMNYAAKLKPLADLVPVVAKTGRESLTERIAEDDGVVGGADRVRISPTSIPHRAWTKSDPAEDYTAQQLEACKRDWLKFLDTFPSDVRESLSSQGPDSAVVVAIHHGIRDLKRLAKLSFYAKYGEERGYCPIEPHDTFYKIAQSSERMIVQNFLARPAPPRVQRGGVTCQKVERVWASPLPDAPPVNITGRYEHRYPDPEDPRWLITNFTFNINQAGRHIEGHITDVLRPQDPADDRYSTRFHGDLQPDGSFLVYSIAIPDKFWGYFTYEQKAQRGRLYWQQMASDENKQDGPRLGLTKVSDAPTLLEAAFSEHAFRKDGPVFFHERWPLTQGQIKHLVSSLAEDKIAPLLQKYFTMPADDRVPENIKLRAAAQPLNDYLESVFTHRYLGIHVFDLEFGRYYANNVLSQGKWTFKQITRSLLDWIQIMLDVQSGFGFQLKQVTDYLGLKPTVTQGQQPVDPTVKPHKYKVSFSLHGFLAYYRGTITVEKTVGSGWKQSFKIALKGFQVKPGFSISEEGEAETYYDWTERDIPGSVETVFTKVGGSAPGVKLSAGAWFMHIFGSNYLPYMTVLGTDLSANLKLDDKFKLDIINLGGLWGEIYSKDLPDRDYSKFAPTTDYRGAYHLQDDVHFCLGSAVLTEDARQSLRIVCANELAGFMSADSSLKIVGHTDRVDTEVRNYELSKMRANNTLVAIRDILGDNFRIPDDPAHLTLEGKGEEEAAKAQPYGQKPDPRFRRVDIFLNSRLLFSLKAQ